VGGEQQGAKKLPDVLPVPAAAKNAAHNSPRVSVFFFFRGPCSLCFLLEFWGAQ
jgi:hypothetical protein